jgi:tRNA1Val (adenine37-N6)-methyltransferase
MRAQFFQFKQFTIQQNRCAMKVGTDGILLGAWAAVAEAQTMLDIGTGTGLLALMLAQRQPTAVIHALELDAASAQQAADNVQASPWTNRVQVWHTAVQLYAQRSLQQYDLIICNPPFWQANAGTHAPQPARHLTRHTTTLTHEDLLACVTTLLADNGRFCCILPMAAGQALLRQAAACNLFCHKSTEVKSLPGKPAQRLLLELGWGERLCQTARIIIENGRRHDYTSEFISLTQDFYLNF